MWLLGIIGEMEVKQDCVTIRCDNHTIIRLTKHQVFNERYERYSGKEVKDTQIHILL